jgi:hypothetical protein
MYKLKLGKLNLVIGNIQFNFNNSILQYNQATIEEVIYKKETNNN